MKPRLLAVLAWVGLVFFAGPLETRPPLPGAAVPEDFPRFIVPGFEDEMQSLREYFWEQFVPEGPYWDDWVNGGEDGNPPYPDIMPAGPKATLWDEWLCGLSLWPAVESGGVNERMRLRWKQKLLTRFQDQEGYIDSDQGAYFGHPHGWPFPWWSMGGGFGWHFSFDKMPTWYRPAEKTDSRGWTVEGFADGGLDEQSWNLAAIGPDAALTTPLFQAEAFEAPLLRIRWKASEKDLGRVSVEWRRGGDIGFGADRRVEIPSAAVTSAGILLPLYLHPRWTGRIVRLRFRFSGVELGARVAVQALFSSYDTRHSINNLAFIRACGQYALWTRDADFVSRNIDRVRKALRFSLRELHVLEERIALTTWPGHDGLSLSGRGIPGNWWDVVPFGNADPYATIHLYDTLRAAADLEEAFLRDPGWRQASQEPAFDPGSLRLLAEEVKAVGNRIFWNDKTGRFVATIDAVGEAHDYGFTELNLAAVACDFATPAQARSILDWVSGLRTVAGDTSRGEDVYHWRFGPRLTTKHNADWWSWWMGTAPYVWGGGVQNGGGVVGFSFYDIAARLKIYGPDDAWRRLQEILRWYREVRNAGGYEKFYAGTDGVIQGGGKPGNVGVNMEFWENAMLGNVPLTVFLGFRPTASGFAVDPRLPSDWPSLTVTRIRIGELTLTVKASKSEIVIQKSEPAQCPWSVELIPGLWTAEYLGPTGIVRAREDFLVLQPGDPHMLKWTVDSAVRLRKRFLK